VKDVVSWLRQYQNPFVNYQNVYFSVGKMGKSYHDVHKSRKTALALMFEYPRDDSRFVCYDELYIEHVLVKLSRPVLEEFVDDTLKELTEPQNAELRETLRVYFECNCSKQEAANKLFVVRQTLYFRLAKIGNMLGADFASPGKRQAIEFALHAHRYMRDVYG
ncbi:MAG: helix-turn-helix domain-containing protein, partial [Clostridiales Family XIII bacterium]|jgi:purine catabolism regulator|nr:helix-turn-helix domain-containing protein [Clostridiales Family XIII bacterium]